MQKTEFQLSGHLYRQSGSTWSNRYIMLSTDTAAMKFYVEKSGKRTMKGQVNIKKGKFQDLSQESCGKPFAFEIFIEELEGKSEDSRLILAAANESEYNEWKEAIFLCFTIVDTRRRKSLLNAIPLPGVSLPEQDGNIKTGLSVPINDNLEDPITTSDSADLTDIQLNSSEPSRKPSLPVSNHVPIFTPSEISNSPPKEIKPISSASKLWSPIETDIISAPTNEEKEITARIEPIQPIQSDLDEEMDGKIPPEDISESLKEALERRGSRKSFKVPKFKNLIATLEAEREFEDLRNNPPKEELPEPIEEKVIEVTSNITEILPEGQKLSRPKDLIISVRPRDPVRMGYLFKLDSSDKEIGEESWIRQFASLEIAVGILEIFAELGGRRILRGRLDLNKCTVQTIDYVFYGKIFAFRIFKNDENGLPSEEIVANFAADDMESFSYWLLSIDDCHKKFRGEVDQPIEETISVNSAELESEGKITEGDSSKKPPIHKEKSFRPFTTNPQANITPLDLSEIIAARSKLHKGEPHKNLNEGQPSSDPSRENQLNEENKHPSKEYPVMPENHHVKIHRQLSRSQSGSKSFSTAFGPIIALNDDNLDEIIGFKSLSKKPSSARLDDLKEVESLKVKVTQISYPSERLSRRVKIWYCSSGFSLSSEDEIQTFVNELKNMDDNILQAFSEEKFSQIQDWAKLLELLRKYEQKTMMDQVPIAEENKPDSIVLKLEVAAPEKTAESFKYTFTDDFEFEEFIKNISRDFSLPEVTLKAKLARILLNKENNPWTQGLSILKEDLTFAEDLVLYQEEVIEHMWESYTAVKGVIEQKDEVINQLYTQLSDLQERMHEIQIGNGPGNLIVRSSSPSKFSKELKAAADWEFYEADRDGDGKINREEWRRWIEDKQNLIQEHSQVKTALMNEIRNLRKALTPSSEQAYQELKKSEDIRRQQEEELVQIHIENDNLREELRMLKNQLNETVQEKSMLESDWVERYENLSKQLEVEKKAFEETKKKELKDFLQNPYQYNLNADISTGFRSNTQVSKLEYSNPSPLKNSFTPEPQIDLLSLANSSVPSYVSNGLVVQKFRNDGPSLLGSSNDNFAYVHSPYTPLVSQPTDSNKASNRLMIKSEEDMHRSISRSGTPSAMTKFAEKSEPHLIGLNPNASNIESHPPKPPNSVHSLKNSSNNSNSFAPKSNSTPTQLNSQSFIPKNIPPPVPSPNITHNTPASNLSIDQHHPLRNALRNENKIKQQMQSYAGYSPVATKPLVNSAKKMNSNIKNSGPIESSEVLFSNDFSKFRQESPNLQSRPNILQNRNTSPQRFMQTTNSWNKKLNNEKYATNTNIVPEGFSRQVGWK